jgi:hypothetical protein
LPRKLLADPFRQAAQLSVLRLRVARYRAAYVAAQARPVKPFVLTVEYMNAFFQRRHEAENVARAYRAAGTNRQRVPFIADGVVREYAAVLGDTLAYRDGAPTRDHVRVHEGALSCIHSTIVSWRNLREELGLDIGCGTNEISEALGCLTWEERRMVGREAPARATARPIDPA